VSVSEQRFKQSAKLKIQVQDNGEGIGREEQKVIFAPFHKSAEKAALSKPGVGLGLSLSLRLAREMKGELSLENSEEGALFTLILPLENWGEFSLAFDL